MHLGCGCSNARGICAQLIDAETGFRKWNETYDRQLTDIFAVQDEIGRAIAKELEVLVTAQPLAEQSTTDPQAYALVLKGRQVNRTQGGSASGRITEAEGLFEQALARDSTYAAAWAEMANVYWRKAYFGTVPTDQVAPAWERARQTAQKALALNPDAGAAHYALSVVAQTYDQDYQAAVEHLERALDANPSDARARSFYGWSLLRLGRTQDALAAAKRAAALDPLSPGVLNNASAVYYYGRRFAQAADLMRAALALIPESAAIHTNLGLILVEMGQYNAAIAEAKQALRTDSTLSVARGALAYAYARSGQEDAARRVLGQLPRTEYMRRATVQLALNDTDAALDLLEQAVDARDPHVADIGMEPAWAELHDNPRFQQIIDRLGLTVIDPALPDPSD